MTMRLLLKNAKVIDSTSPHHGKKVDIFIQNGIIEKVGKRISVADAEIIKVKDLHISMGWLDVGTQVCDPGLEHREDLETVSQAAAKGGFTGIACFPNTDPTVHSKSQVQYIIKNTKGNLVDVYPIGAVTSNCNGRDITEMYDMNKAGAVAFSDGGYSIEDNGMMMRALQYVKPFNGVIINHPHDKTTALNGQIHEGLMSTSLGMRGIPSLSEELMIIRDIYLAEYTDSRLHIHNVSTAKGVRLIKNAKKKNLKITASVAAMNLVFTDNDLESFDTHLKVLPPLRESNDIKALKKGLKEGTIDCITSNHRPWHIEAKDLEFPYAEFGAIGLETTFGVVNPNVENNLEGVIDALSLAPRSILGLEMPSVKKGNRANLTLFNPNKIFTFEEKDIRSKSKNSPFIGKELQGEIIGVINNNLMELF